VTKKYVPIVLSVILFALVIVTVGLASNGRGEDMYPGIPATCEPVLVSYPGVDNGIWSWNCTAAPTPISIQGDDEPEPTAAAPMTITRPGRSR